MFNRILVPLDGSSLAERALPHAVEFARIFGSKIVLLHVLDPSSYHENPNTIDPLNWQIRKAEADMYMTGIIEKVQKDMRGVSLNTTKEFFSSDATKSSRVVYFIREGKSAETIIRFAQTEKIDLLVISTHGSSGISRWNISSVTQKVINSIYLPVLIIRSYNETAPNSEKIHYRKILLPIDSSLRAEFAISAGIALAGSGKPTKPDIGIKQDKTIQSAEIAMSDQKTKLIFVTVIKPPEIPIPEPIPEEISHLIEELMDVSRDAVKIYMKEMVEHLPVECETRVIENISVSSAIQDIATQGEDIDLIILCAHGYTGQLSYPYGSIAHHMIQHGTKPVLVVQDVPRAHIQLSEAEKVAKKFGDR
jgi:nucleotide-binding universal stress UspA family protein